MSDSLTGSGSGRDAYVASALVGKAGKVVGVDMTDAQLDGSIGLLIRLLLFAHAHIYHVSACLPAVCLLVCLLACLFDCLFY